MALREAKFLDAYILNGENGTRAYMEAWETDVYGTAATEAYRLLKKPHIRKALDERRAAISERFQLTTDRVIREIARMAYFNPKRMLDGDGKMLPLHRIDEDTAAALQTIEITETEIVDGREVVRHFKVKPFNKASALDQANRILRLYEQAAPPPEQPADEEIDEHQLAQHLAFVLAREAVAVAKRSRSGPEPSAKRAKKAA